MESFLEEILYSHEEIVRQAEKMGNEISREYEGKTPILIGLLKGSVPFMAELIKHITIDMQIDFMKVSSYSGTKSTGSVHILSDCSSSLKNRDVIIVEDIIDTGLTLSEVKKVLLAKGANSVEFCTLLDKVEGREFKEINAKYVGFEVPNKFVVGFGLDYNEKYRNLPYIGVLKKEIYSNE